MADKKHPESTCSGKFAFERFTLAAGSVRVTRKQKKGAIKPYRCPFCSKWHVGHHKKEKKV